MAGKVRADGVRCALAGDLRRVHGEQGDGGAAKKSGRPTERPVTAALYLLRAKQIGLTIADMEQLEEGMVYELMAEMANDEAQSKGAYRQVATQKDFDKF